MKFVKPVAPNVTVVGSTPQTSLPVKFPNMIIGGGNPAAAPKKLFAASCGTKIPTCAPLNRK